MTIPLLEYTPSTRNERVKALEIASEEQPRVYTTEGLPSEAGIDELIWAAYRQIFNEQQILASNRQTSLESQLRAGQITVQEFIRGLVTSDTFRQRNYDTNNNYRFVQMCVQRLLGRDVYSEREKHSLSIVLAVSGLQGFVDTLVNSDEYQENFGNSTVPYQRRRILPQRDQGELPFARMPRYGEDHLQQLEALGNKFSETAPSTYSWAWQRPPYPRAVQLFGKSIVVSGALFVTLGTVAVILSWFGWIRL